MGPGRVVARRGGQQQGARRSRKGKLYAGGAPPPWPGAQRSGVPAVLRRELGKVIRLDFFWLAMEVAFGDVVPYRFFARWCGVYAEGRFPRWAEGGEDGIAEGKIACF